MTALAPELLWTGDRFGRDLAVELDESSGRITRVGLAAELAAAGARLERLPGRALLPGFVNAHSHAFQRVMRGRTQWRPERHHSDFWSWRGSMYAAALALEAADVFDVARFCFIEMLLAGYTTVGEFHYLQRDRDGSAYSDPLELARRVLAAAAAVGIRIALLNVCYATGGIGQPLAREQRRFATPSLDAYLEATGELARAHAGGLASVGVAPHSVRAVPREWLAPIADWARKRGLPLHVHAAEQPAEVEACVSAHGVRPVELLNQEGVLGPDTTLVHATHISDAEVALIAASGARVCACPTTERDLGDGFLRGRELLAAGVGVAIGTDSQTVIDPLEELRLIEYHERLRGLRRVVVGRAAAGRVSPAALLLECGTASGAVALGVDAGRIARDAAADLVAIDLGHPSLAGWDDESLAAMVVLSAPAGIVRDVWVGGVRRVAEGRHGAYDEAAAGIRRVAAGVPHITPSETLPESDS